MPTLRPSAALLLAPAAVAPWWFGCATATGQAALAAALAVAALVAAGESDDEDDRDDDLAIGPAESRERQTIARPVAGWAWAVVVALFLALGVVQLVPPWTGDAFAAATIGPPDADLVADRAAQSLVPRGTVVSIAWAILAFAAAAVAAVAFRGRRRTLLLVTALLLAATLAAFGIVQSLTWNGRLFWTVPLQFGGQPFSSYVNRNNAAALLNLGLVAGWALLARRAAAPGRRDDRTDEAMAGNPPRLRDADPSSRVQATGRTRRRRVRRGPLATATAAAGTTLTRPVRSRVEAARVAALTEPPRERVPNFIPAILAAAALIAGGLVVCGSRSGLLSALAGGFAAIVAWRLTDPASSRTVVRLGGAAAIVGLAAAAAAIAFGPADGVFGRLETVRDLALPQDGRFEHWPETLRGSRDWLAAGTGLGGYRFTHRPYQRHAAAAVYHNADSEWVEWWFEAGAAGAVCWGVALLVALSHLAATIRLGDVTAAVLVAGLLAGQLVHAAFDFGLTLPANLTLAALLFGSTLSPNLQREPYGRSVGTLVRRGLVAAASVAAAVALFLTWEAERFVTAERVAAATREAIVAATDEDPRPAGSLRPLDELDAETAIALREVERLLAMQPYQGPLHLAKARLLTLRMRLAIVEAIDPEFADRSSERQAELFDATEPAALAVSFEIARVDAPSDAPPPTFAAELPAAADDARREACAAFGEALRWEPLLPRAAIGWACLVDPGESPAPERLLRHETSLAPSDGQRLEAIGLLARRIGQPDLAAECFARALRTSPERTAPILRTALRTADPAGETTSATDLIGVVVPSDDFDALLALARLTQQTDPAEHSLIVDAVEAALRAGGGATVNPVGWAELAELRGQPAVAAKHYRVAVERRPFRVALHTALVRCLVDAGEDAAAADASREAANRFPSEPYFRETLRRLSRENRR